MLDPIGASVLKSKINSYLGMLFVGSFGLLASVVIIQAAFGYNPLTKAFENTIYRHSSYVPSLP